MSSLGKRIREIRKNKNITLQELSEKTGLSIGFLSKVERDLNSPNLANLYKICQVLHIQINDLLEEKKEYDICVKKADRRVIYEYKGILKNEAATEGDRLIKGTILTMISDVEHHSAGHFYEELGIVLQGSCQFIINGKKYVLEKGDTIYIEANTPHDFKKLSEEECITFWAKAEKPRDFK
ncbi:MAG: cupin domain-containing protein [Thermoanaerobacteraceae bacterium]|nr:cupin domain-containing protein [Thermoanaerobacteraceae bacterium]